jgi:hypothetical protein
VKGAHLFYAGVFAVTAAATGLLWGPFLEAWTAALWHFPPRLPEINWTSLTNACLETFLLFTFFTVGVRLILMLAAEKDPNIGVVKQEHRTPEKTGLGPALSHIDQGAAAGAKFFIGLLLIAYLNTLVTANLDPVVISIVGTIVFLVMLFLLGSAFVNLSRNIATILESPALTREVSWKEVLE